MKRRRDDYNDDFSSSESPNRKRARNAFPEVREPDRPTVQPLPTKTCFNWAKFACDVAASINQHRRTKREDCARRFGLATTYRYLPEVLDAEKSGRANFKRWEHCRHEVLKYMADRQNKTLDPEQVLLLDALRDVQLPQMYGSFEKASTDLPWLKNMFGIGELDTAVALIQPRRQGKTMINALANVVTLLSQTEPHMYTYALAMETAVSWMNYVKEFADNVKTHPVYGWKEIKYTNGRKLQIQLHRTERHAWAMAYGNASMKHFAKFLRGTANDAWMENFDEGLFFCDEANTVIYPTTRNGCAIALMSSKMKKKNMSTDLLSARYLDSGRRIWRVLDWRNQCEACAAKERETGRTVECKHKTVKPPAHFVTYSHVARMEGLMATIGGHDTELLNMDQHGDDEPCFDPEAVDATLGDTAALSGLPPKLVRPHSHFFVSIDPGANRSETAIVSACFLSASGRPDEFSGGMTPVAGHMVILAVEKFGHLLPRLTAEAVAAQIAAVRRLSFMQNAHALIVCESNFGTIAYELKDQFTREFFIPNSTYLHMNPITGARSWSGPAGASGFVDGGIAGTPMSPGLMTTNQTKLFSADRLNLILRERRIHWNVDGVVTYATPVEELETQVEEDGKDALLGAGPIQGPQLLQRMIHERAARVNRRVFVQQLKGLKRIVTMKKMATGEDKAYIKITGKVGYDPETHRPNNDDAAMALMILVDAASRFYLMPEYAPIRNHNGIHSS